MREKMEAAKAEILASDDKCCVCGEPGSTELVHLTGEVEGVGTFSKNVPVHRPCSDKAFGRAFPHAMSEGIDL